MIKQSKFLSFVLRHDPASAGIELDGEGWVKVSDIMRALREKFGHFTREQLQELVDTNEKKRFSFDQHGLRIRANQGHSLKTVDLKMEPVEPPVLLYHGTKRDFLDSISKEGLKPGSRQHVHLSGDIATAKNVAGRRRGESVILIVQAGRLTMEGHSFYQSDNGVWLTDSVPVGFFEAYFEHFTQ